jgi:hypothetical protein
MECEGLSIVENKLDGSSALGGSKYKVQAKVSQLSMKTSRFHTISQSMFTYRFK